MTLTGTTLGLVRDLVSSPKSFINFYYPDFSLIWDFYFYFLLQHPLQGRSTWGKALVWVASRRFMVAARGMAPAHHTSARAVVPFHATSCSSCRRWASLMSIPRGIWIAIPPSLTNDFFWLWKFAYWSLCCSGRLITSQGRRDLDQVAGRVAVEAWAQSHLRFLLRWLHFVCTFGFGFLSSERFNASSYGATLYFPWVPNVISRLILEPKIYVCKVSELVSMTYLPFGTDLWDNTIE